MTHARRAFLVWCFAVLALLALSLKSFALEGPTIQVKRVSYEAAYSAELVHYLVNIRTAKPAHICNFFGYRVACIREAITARDWRRAKRNAKLHAADIVRGLVKSLGRNAPDGIFLRNGVAEEGTIFGDHIPIFASGKIPGYVPYAAYDGSISDLYKLRAQQATAESNDTDDGRREKWFEGKDWFGVSSDVAGGLKKLVVTNFNYKEMVVLPKDEVGEEVFGDFAEISDIADGDGVLA